MSERLLRSGVELSVDRYEMAERARADREPVDGFTDESSVLLLTGWVGTFNLWMARPEARTCREHADTPVAT